MKLEGVGNLTVFRAGLLERQKELESQIASIKADLDAVDRLIHRYNGQGETSAEYEMVSAYTWNFAQTTRREAVLKLLKMQYPNDMHAKELAEKVLMGGFKTDSPQKNFEAAIWSLLAQMVQSGQVQKTGPGRFKAVK